MDRATKGAGLGILVAIALALSLVVPCIAFADTLKTSDVNKSKGGDPSSSFVLGQTWTAWSKDYVEFLQIDENYWSNNDQFSFLTHRYAGGIEKEYWTEKAWNAPNRKYFVIDDWNNPGRNGVGGWGFGVGSSHPEWWNDKILFLQTRLWVWDDANPGPYVVNEAVFYPRIYVKYYSDGTCLKTQEKWMGSGLTLSPPSTPSKTGYTFGGWMASMSNGKTYTVPSSGVTVGPYDWNSQYFWSCWEYITINGKRYLQHGNTTKRYVGLGLYPTSIRYDSGNESNIAAVTAKWTPNTYYVRFNGNGNTNTSVSMPNQTFTYDKAQKLSANKFERSYTLEYDAQGGSAGTGSKTCAWPFAGWSKQPSASAAYANQQSVSNLTASALATVDLYAQWNKGYVTLPDPGTRDTFTWRGSTYDGWSFDGWYDAPEGGNRIGGVGDSVSISKNTKIYAHWAPTSAQVTYFADGEQIASETAPLGVMFTPADDVDAHRENCNAGFKGWYSNSACTTTFAEAELKGDLSLYAYNTCTLKYANSTANIGSLATQTCFGSSSDQATPKTLANACGMPSTRPSIKYGSTISLSQVSRKTVWCLADAGHPYKVYKEEAGWHRKVDASDGAITRLTMKSNATVYAKWELGTYEGVSSR